MYRTIFILTMILLIEIVIVGTIVSKNTVVSHMNSEFASLEIWLGENTAKHLKNKTDRVFTALFKDSGLINWSLQLFVSTEEQANKEVGLQNLRGLVFPYVTERMVILWQSVYRIILRLEIMLLWIPYLLPLIIPGIIDGMMTREIKKESHGYTSPTWYHTSLHIVVILIFLLMVYLFIPFAMPAWIIPLWLFGLSFTMIMLISNVHKYI